MDVKKLVYHYLREAKIMQIATVHDGKPWICTVNFAPDENGSLYWMSLRSTNHSQHIKDTPFIAGAIVNDPEHAQGLQFEGKAEELSGENLEKANQAYELRYGHKPERMEEAKSQDATKRAYYKVTPIRVIVFDKTNIDNPRQEYIV